MSKVIGFWSCSLFLTLLAACEHERPCSRGFEYDDGACVCAEGYALVNGRCRAVTPAPDAAGAGGAGGGRAADGGADAPAEAASSTVDDVIGQVCTADPDCDPLAPYCAVQPGSATGFCTVRDCDPADDQCPAGYACFDLGMPQLVPTFCNPS